MPTVDSINAEHKCTCCANCNWRSCPKMLEGLYEIDRRIQNKFDPRTPLKLDVFGVIARYIKSNLEGTTEVHESKPLLPTHAENTLLKISVSELSAKLEIIEEENRDLQNSLQQAKTTIAGLYGIIESIDPNLDRLTELKQVLESNSFIDFDREEESIDSFQPIEK